MKSLPFVPSLWALALGFTTVASAQLKPEKLAGRWMLVASAPTSETLAKEYSEFVGYSPSRAKDIIDEIRKMRKERKPQLVRFTDSSMSFEGVEVFGAGAAFTYEIAGNKLNVTFSGVSGNTGGAGAKVKELVPEFFVASLRGTSLTLKSGPISGYQKKSITYKLKRYTKVEGEMRDWSGPGGKKFQAKVVDYKNGTAMLKNKQGKMIKISASKLAKEDKDYLVQLIKDSK